MEPEGSLLYTQATRPYPEPIPSSPHNPFPLPEDPSATWGRAMKWWQGPTNTGYTAHTISNELNYYY